MNDHDLRCRGKDHEVGLGCCDCAFIDLIRFEQNERIAQAIEARADVAREQAKASGSARYWEAAEAYEAAARIARNGGSDE